VCPGDGWYGGNDTLEELVSPFEIEGLEAFNKLPKIVACGLDGGPIFAFFSS